MLRRKLTNLRDARLACACVLTLFLNLLLILGAQSHVRLSHVRVTVFRKLFVSRIVYHFRVHCVTVWWYFMGD